MLLILRIYLQFSEESCCFENPETRRMMITRKTKHIYLFMHSMYYLSYLYVSQSVKSLGIEQTSERQFFIYLYFMFLNRPSPSVNIMQIIIAK